jgi:hypothetical protein
MSAVEFGTLIVGRRDQQALAELSEKLDRMDAESRRSTLMTITPREQRILWELCAGRSISAQHFVPENLDPLVEVIHHGKNSLLAHNFFQKRFARADDGTADLYGYNHQTLAFVTGPGYFVAHSSENEVDAPTGYVIDYTRIPPRKPASWPKIIPNEARLGRFVYAGMKDYMRRVSEHVSIGRAYKRGKPMNAWFVLCREDPAGARR